MAVRGAVPGIHQVVVQNLAFNRGRTVDFVNLCNSLQSATYFALGPEVEADDAAPFRMADGRYDLDAWIKTSSARLDARRPLMIITGLAYGDPEYVGDPDGDYFLDLNVEFGGAYQQMTVVSLRPWLERFPGDENALPYLLLMTSAWFLGRVGADGFEIPFHDETNGCLFDFCAHLDDILRIVEVRDEMRAPLCVGCWRLVDKGLKSGALAVDGVAAALSLYFRAVGKRSAFLAVPYAADHAEISDTTARTLTEMNFKSFRANEFRYLKDIGTRMRVLIRCVETVIADVSSGNANVLFELGLADGIGKDTLVLSSQRPLPFDLGFHHTIFYDSLADLERQLRDEFEQARLPEPRYGREPAI